MPITFSAADAHRTLAETIYGLDGATRMATEYLACTTWDEFFQVNPVNTSLFIEHYNFMSKFDEAEQYILQHVNTAIKYAVNVLTTRWTELEAVLLADYANSTESMRMLRNAITYASVLINTRWPELETFLMSCIQAPRNTKYDTGRVLEYMYTYLSIIADSRVENLEEALYQQYEPNRIVDLMQLRNVTGSLVNFETVLLSKLVAPIQIPYMRAAVRYAINIKRSRWSNLELIIDNNPSAVEIFTYRHALFSTDDKLRML